MAGTYEIWVIDDVTGWFLEYATDDSLAADVVADWCKGVDLMFVMITEGSC